MKKLIFSLGVFILLTSLFFVYFIFRDIPPIDDSDLLILKLEIPKEENAYFPLKEAIDKIYIPKGKGKIIDDIVYKDSWDEEFVKELLEKNKDIFEIFEKSAKYKYFQFPHLEANSYISLSNDSRKVVAKLSELSKLVIIKSKYLINQGKEKEALDLILELIKIGHMIEEGFIHDSIIYSLGVQTKKQGLKALIKLAPYLHLSKEEFKNYINRIESFNDNRDGLIRAFKGDYMNFLKEKEVMEQTLKNEFNKNNPIATFINFPDYIIFSYFSYKPNETRKLIADLYRDLIDKANRICHEIENYKTKNFKSEKKTIFNGNSLGKTIYKTKSAKVYILIEEKCYEIFYVELVKTLLALRSYNIERLSFPLSLKDLIPEYLNNLPKDPFDGKSLKYSPKEKVIYSPKGEKFFIDF